MVNGNVHGREQRVGGVTMLLNLYVKIHEDCWLNIKEKSFKWKSKRYMALFYSTIDKLFSRQKIEEVTFLQILGRFCCSVFDHTYSDRSQVTHHCVSVRQFHDYQWHWVGFHTLACPLHFSRELSIHTPCLFLNWIDSASLLSFSWIADIFWILISGQIYILK